MQVNAPGASINAVHQTNTPHQEAFTQQQANKKTKPVVPMLNIGAATNDQNMQL